MPPTHTKSKRTPVPSKRASEIVSSSRVTRPKAFRTKTKPRIPVHIDLTSTESSNLESIQTVSKKALKLIEPLPTKYALSIEISVGEVTIYLRLMLQTVGTFDYTGFLSVEAQKTLEHCARLGRVTSIRISKATIVYNKKDACDSHIDNPEEWRLFDEMAGTYLGDKSKKDLHINWNISYQLKVLSTEPEKEAIELYKDDDEAETEDDEKDKDHSKRVGLLYMFNTINILIIGRKRPQTDGLLRLETLLIAL
ncbi:MAG: hypothetical protein M1840_006651 [Geoglossum simile]|nr:MAG: hypothetical protein M1840_006651 [Geoglossum simile]